MYNTYDKKHSDMERKYKEKWYQSVWSWTNMGEVAIHSGNSRAGSDGLQEVHLISALIQSLRSRGKILKIYARLREGSVLFTTRDIIKFYWSFYLIFYCFYNKKCLNIALLNSLIKKIICKLFLRYVYYGNKFLEDEYYVGCYLKNRHELASLKNI